MPSGTEEELPEVQTPSLRSKVLRWALLAFASTALLGAVYVAAAAVTDRPEFCATACHEMRPFVDAWEQGPHKDQWCVDCHVDPGYSARLLHKFKVFKEIAAHFTGDTSFPRAVAPKVPSERCQRCHKTVVASGFPHPIHSETACAKCHAGEGHDVAIPVLKAAGLYSGNIMAVQVSSVPVKINGGVANLPGHKTVICSRCHDMKATPCSACHKPKHNDHANRGTDCQSCHSTNAVGWTFSHPTGGNSCAECHSVPAKHYQPSSGSLPPCVTCHTKVGVSWAASAHPGATSDCKGCHPLPAKHYQAPSALLAACASCHTQVGKSWAFAHPGPATTCKVCHSLPAKHYQSACATCHTQVGKSWAFAHPSAGVNCKSCHTPPANHATGNCSDCHHSTTAFTFNHPNTGEHSAKSFVCAKCHPHGYTSYSCTCHGSNSPGEGGGEGGEHREGGERGGHGDGDD
jgi:hypothetical protein